MTIALVTHVEAAGTNTFTSSGIDTTGAAFLVAIVSDYQGTGPATFSDSKGNTWTTRTQNGTATYARCRMLYAVDPVVGSGHTFTLTGASNFGSICVMAFSAAPDTTVTYDGNGTGATDSPGLTSNTPGSITPSSNNQVVITGIAGFDVGSSSASINGGFTIAGQTAYSVGVNFGSGGGYLIQTTAGAANPTWSWTGNAHMAGIIASFKEVANDPTLTLEGPTTGSIDEVSTDFTITQLHGDTTVTATIHDSVSDSELSDTSFALNPAGTFSYTFTVTPTTAGPRTISVTNDGGLSNPASIIYTVAAANREDTFNRTDAASLGTPSDGGPAWDEESGTWAITSNRARKATADNTHQVAGLTSTVAAVEVEATLAVIPNATGNQLGGLAINIADADNFIFATTSGSTYTNGINLFKRVAGVNSQVGSTSAGPASAGDVMRLRRDSANLVTVFINDIQRVSETITEGHTVLNHGLYSYRAGTNAIEFEDFTITRAVGHGFNAWGDSLTVGFGATDPWPTLLSPEVNKTIANQGINGAQVIDFAEAMYGVAAGAAFIGGCINDTIRYGTNATKRGYAVSCLGAMIGFSGLPTKTWAQDATAVGTWTDGTTIYNGAITKYSSTAGDTLTFHNVAGTVFYVGFTGSEADNGSASVSVNGNVLGSVDSATLGITSASTLAYGPQMARFAKPAGTHDVVLTQTRNGKPFYADWVAGIGNQAEFNPVIVGNTSLQTDAGAAGYATLGTSVANTLAYNVDWATKVAQLAGDGMNVRLVDIKSAINIATHLISDGLHWNDAGQQAAADAYFRAFLPLAPVIGTVTVSGNSVSVSFADGGAGADDETTSYTVTSDHGGYTATGSASPIVITGLASGVYTFSVHATNAVGDGDESSESSGAIIVDVSTGTGGIDPGLVKPTGLATSKRKAKTKTQQRIEETRDDAAEIAARLSREFTEENAAIEAAANARAAEIQATLTEDQITQEISLLLSKKLRTEEDEILLLLLMAVTC